MCKVVIRLRQGFVMSPWSFDIFIQSFIKNMNIIGKEANLWQQYRDISVILFTGDMY